MIVKQNRGSTRAFSLTRENLRKLRVKAVRKGCWFKVLKQKERMLLNLTVNVVERVRSSLLSKVVSGLVDKLFEALQSRIYRLMKSKGQEMALHVSDIAQGWGNKLAKGWGSDVGLMQFLVVSNLQDFWGY